MNIIMYMFLGGLIVTTEMLCFYAGRRFITLLKEEVNSRSGSRDIPLLFRNLKILIYA
jgi:hypothetical protein